MKTTTEQLLDVPNFSTCRIQDFDLDIAAIINDYAIGYLNHSHVHESLDEFCQRVAGDLKMSEAALWARKAVKKLEKEMVTV